ncbi:MAG: carboxypeptidase regulatory-like domain-containing protein [Acidobacteria bacterium]|nr:carboxypeptidase regulatory-like domain-containing protein [Acidobacteriota bacterium]
MLAYAPGAGSFQAPVRRQQAFLPNAPAATIVSHWTTGEEAGPACAPPPPKANFLTSDQRVYQWTLLSGAQMGDVVRWDFRQPNGSTYFQTDPITINFNGGVCIAAFISIAGAPAASLPGAWEVRVTYNGAMLTSDAFTISNSSITATVTEQRTTGDAPANNCATPTLKTSFAPTDERVYHWTLVSGAQTGDRVRWQFVQPDGTVYASSSTLTLTGGGSRCFWVSIDIAGQPAANLHGVWQVRVFYNDQLLLPTPPSFTIGPVQNNCPTVNNISPSSGAPGSTVTITGTNFTGVTGVRFSNNVAANFTVTSNTQITGTVPSEAVTGPITIIKPNCADQQTQPFTVLVRPVIEAMPTAIDFGNVNTGLRASRDLRLRNIGNAPLLISGITSSNPRFAVQLQSSTFGLNPGGSVDLQVLFTPAAGGNSTGMLAINSNDPAQPRLDVMLSGAGIAPKIEVTPEALNFGSAPLGQTRDMIFLIRNTGAAALRITDLSSDNQPFAVIALIEKPSGNLLNPPFDIAPGGSVDVTVRFRPPVIFAGIGPQTGAVVIASNDPMSPQLDVALAGVGLGAWIAAPAEVNFGSVTACEPPPAAAAAPVVNQGNIPLDIAALSIPDRSFALAAPPAPPITIPPGGALNLPLRFATAALGPRQSRLLISSNAANGPASIELRGAALPIPTPQITGISVSRTTLSHGRADNARPASPFNPFGLAGIIGFAFPGGLLQPGSIAPGIAPPPLIGAFPGLPAAAIAAAPDPLRITLAGGAANPIVLAAANIPSAFTLAVAEGVTFPALTRWHRVGSRFGSGNLYAAVSIPGTGIVAGMELVTEADLDAYTANSIIYEAPDFGFVVTPSGQSGGTATLQARPRRAPADPQCTAVFGTPQSVQVEYARTVRIEILPEQTAVTRVNGDFAVRVAARISGNFDPALNTVVRWAYDGQAVDLVQDLPDMTPPGAPRVLMHTFNVPAADACTLARITVVATSTGNLPFAPPPVNPFLELAPVTIGLFTFRSGGSTIEDAASVLVRATDADCTGGGAAVGWIRGVVSNLATGAPIVGASVSASGTGISTTTGFDGSYELNSVPAGATSLIASANGFDSSTVQVNVTAGQTAVQNISLSARGGSVQGTVYNAATNQPVAGASIQVKGTSISTSSGGNGAFVLPDVPAGWQTIIASAPGYDSDEAVLFLTPDAAIARDFYLTPNIGAITGIVRESATNAPIAGAVVSAAGVTAITDGAGAFTLNDLPTGPLTVSASAPDYNPTSGSINLLPGQTPQLLIVMTPQLGVITGIVRDETGTAIPNATVSAAGVTATTGANGSYTLTNVRAGSQTLSASATDYTPSSAAVVVAGDQTVQQDINLVRKTGNLQGRVTDAATNQPIANAEVDLLLFPLVFAETNASGDYTITGAPAGQQVFIASAPGYYGKIGVVNIPADQTATLNFALTRRVGQLTGTILSTRAGEFGISGATIEVAGTGIAVTSSQRGDYFIDNIPAGALVLNVSAPGYKSTQATTIIFPNERTYKDIYLETPVGAVRGTVRNAANNQPISGAQLLIGIPFGAIYYSALTDAGGNYTFNDVRTGSVTIYAGAVGFLPGQATVTVAENQTTIRDFLLTPDAPLTGSVTGTVRNASNNQPIGGASVSLLGLNISTTTAADGAYTLSNAPPGTHTLSASATGFAASTIQVTVVGGQTLNQNVSLAPSVGTVTGTVRNAANANPIVGAMISVAGTNMSTTSGAGGVYTINDVPAGAQTLNASAEGFSSSQLQINVVDGQTLTQNISLSPTLPPGEIRITLNWTKDASGFPRDLDAHLIGPRENNTCFHVFYSTPGHLAVDPFARLEVDNINVSGAPPTETIRISKLIPGTYRFYVHDFGAEYPDGLSRSRATVQVFGSSGQLGSFTVPNGSGGNWTVFEINGQTGQITTINQLASPAQGCN